MARPEPAPALPSPPSSAALGRVAVAVAAPAPAAAALVAAAAVAAAAALWGSDGGAAGAVASKRWQVRAICTCDMHKDGAHAQLSRLDSRPSHDAVRAHHGGMHPHAHGARWFIVQVHQVL